MTDNQWAVEVLDGLVAYARRTHQPDLQVALMYALVIAAHGGGRQRPEAAEMLPGGRNVIRFPVR